MMTPSLVPKPCGQKSLSAGELCLGSPALSTPSSVKRREEEPQKNSEYAAPSDGGLCWRALLGEGARVGLQGRLLWAGEAMGELCLGSALRAGWSPACHSTSLSLGVLISPQG